VTKKAAEVIKAIPMEITGPRRLVRIRPLEQPLLLHSKEDSQPATAATSRWGSLTAKVSHQVRSYNAFEETVTIDDHGVVARGKCKTCLYMPSYAIAVLAMVLYFVLTPQTTQLQSSVYPPYAEYAGFAEQVSARLSLVYFAALIYISTPVVGVQTPNCPCSGDATFGSGALLAIPPWANYTTNACGAISTIVGPSVAAALASTTTLENAILIQGFLVPMADFCSVVSVAQQVFFNEFLLSSVGSAVLLSQAQFQSDVTQAFMTKLQAFSNVVNSYIAPLEFSTWQAPRTLRDYSQNASSTNPVGCNCSADSIPWLPIPVGPLRTCTFTRGFDWRPAVNKTWFSCDVGSNVMSFPIDLLAPTTYAALGLPPQLWPNVTFVNRFNGSTFVDVLLSACEGMFTSTLPAPDAFTKLLPGIVSLDHTRYYAACAPKQCSYTVQQRPTIAAAVTTALGVIAGASAVMRIVVGMLVDKLWHDASIRRLGIMTDLQEKASSADVEQDAQHLVVSRLSS
jgi:hypothetical protein